MFDYPQKAEFNRVIPKVKVYDYGKPTRALRKRIVTQIEAIVWKYKLSPETINLPARDGIEEIQVFAITLKSGELSENVLRNIDRSIPSPVFFELVSDNRVKFTAAYKRPSEAAANKSVVDAYYDTEWQPESSSRMPLPVALDLATLYEQMLRRHIPFPTRAGEPLPDQIERISRIRAKQTECRRLESQLKAERQFNRKVEINAALRLRNAELAQLQQT